LVTLLADYHAPYRAHGDVDILVGKSKGSEEGLLAAEGPVGLHADVALYAGGTAEGGLAHYVPDEVVDVGEGLECLSVGLGEVHGEHEVAGPLLPDHQGDRFVDEEGAQALALGPLSLTDVVVDSGSHLSFFDFLVLWGSVVGGGVLSKRTGGSKVIM
jgi:hypothetical protein